MKLLTWFFCASMLVACGGGGGGATSGSAVASTYTIGGSISGLGSASGLTLSSGTETIPVSPNAAAFTFSTKLAQNAGYSVTVASQPLGKNCTVTGGTGTVLASNIDAVAVRCTAVQLAFSLFAGNLGSPGAVDATGSAARFSNPQSTAIDNAGNVYVADRGNHTIRKISPAGVVSTLAGTAGSQGWDDGLGAAARFDNPTGIAVDGTGNVYVADTRNSTIRKITPAGVVSTFAGRAGIYGAGVGTADGIGAEARFFAPGAIAVDKAGNLYVADTGNHSIRKVTPAGAVSTLAGKGNEFGSADGVGPLARFASPKGIAVDAAGNVFVADTLNRTIRKITPLGVVSTVAGSIGTTGSADGAGVAATFFDPMGMVADGDGNLYIADTGNHTIRKLTPTGVVSTLVGTVGASGSLDGVGAMARFSSPSGLSMDTAGNMYVADAGNSIIRKVTAAGNVSTLAGTAFSKGSADGIGAAAGFSNPHGIATNSLGNVYVSDFSNSTVRKISPSGSVSTLAGTAGASGSADGVGAAARFSYTSGIATDGAGNVYVGDFYNSTIRKITPSGAVSTLAGTNLAYGSADGTGAEARFSYPHSLATDGAGNVYVTDFFNHTVRKISPAGVVSTLAGSARSSGSSDGIGAAALFDSPHGIAVDKSGNVYVADTNNQTIRKITPAGVVSTLAGTVRATGNADGTGAAARFNYPSGLAVDAAGNVYVADYLNLCRSQNHARWCRQHTGPGDETGRYPRHPRTWAT